MGEWSASDLAEAVVTGPLPKGVSLTWGTGAPGGKVVPDGSQAAVDVHSAAAGVAPGGRYLCAWQGTALIVLGTSRGTFDPHRSLYVPPGGSLAAWRNRVLAAKYGRSTTVAVVGSSSVVGVGATTILDGWAHLLRDRFADAGYPIQGTGLMHVGGARLASDPRWTWNGSVTVPGDGTFQPKLHATIPSGAWASTLR